VTDSNSIDELTAFRIGRALIDGATPEWAALHFSVPVSEISDAWNRTEKALEAHFSGRDGSAATLESLLDGRVSEVLDVLVQWIDYLSLPPVPTSEPPPDESLEQKKGTGQGETEP
jgi:hypothetical protein